MSISARSGPDCSMGSGGAPTDETFVPQHYSQRLSPLSGQDRDTSLRTLDYRDNAAATYALSCSGWMRGLFSPGTAMKALYIEGEDFLVSLDGTLMWLRDMIGTCWPLQCSAVHFATLQFDHVVLDEQSCAVASDVDTHDESLSSTPGADAGQLPGDHGPAILAIQVVMILLTTTSVVLRFLARHLGTAKIWFDDWAILIAAFFSFGINITNIIGVQYGMGKHFIYVPDQGRKYLQTFYAIEVTYTMTLAMVKIGVLLMYKRLFGIDRKFTIAVHITMGLVICWWIGVTTATLFQCQPIHRLWDFRSKEGHCFDIMTFFEASSIPNIITDVIILLLPQPIIWKLRLDWSTRLGICAIFLLGAFTACTSIGRLVAMLLFNDPADFTYHAYAVLIWFSLEPPIGILCACLPCMGAIFRRLPGSPFASMYKGSVSASSNAHTSVSGPRISTFGVRGERGWSDIYAESIRSLRPGNHSCKSSIHVDVRESTDPTPNLETRSYEMDVLHSRT